MLLLLILYTIAATRYHDAGEKGLWKYVCASLVFWIGSSILAGAVTDRPTDGLSVLEYCGRIISYVIAAMAVKASGELDY